MSRSPCGGITVEEALLEFCRESLAVSQFKVHDCRLVFFWSLVLGVQTPEDGRTGERENGRTGEREDEKLKTRHANQSVYDGAGDPLGIRRRLLFTFKEHPVFFGVSPDHLGVFITFVAGVLRLG
ncbi:hypothetical protein EYF80_003549 [Liparis tanakae]|uniref:Uncharacterized protein n=1 Tax=Liparis tanakae TaxID=230148 RepID=A0A4Z2J9N5_9TELE|nr:hypothetical protein EYF80_003549 [Liparis tanakae]